MLSTTDRTDWPCIMPKLVQPEFLEMAYRNARVIAIALLAFVTGASAADDEPKPPSTSEPKLPVPSEPTKCFRLVGTFDAEMPIGLATDLCGGTTDAMATLSCFVEAFSSRESGGLGLNRGSAIALCRPAGTSTRQ